MSDIRVHIIDYGLGNLGSIVNMFRRLGVGAKLTSDPDDIMSAEHILLPGVGAFDQGMRNLRERGLVDVLNKKVIDMKTPTLGICLGMQLMTEGSDEGVEKGLGWIRGRTVDMRNFANAGDKMKFPHIGWNYVDQVRDHFINHDLPEDPRFYFVHSYMVACDEQDDVLATSDYGSITMTAMLAHGNIAGAQYHPEKSHKFGMQLLRNFSTWVPSA
jgi:glutamine amidotransferase